MDSNAQVGAKESKLNTLRCRIENVTGNVISSRNRLNTLNETLMGAQVAQVESRNPNVSNTDPIAGGIFAELENSVNAIEGEVQKLVETLCVLQDSNII